MWGTCTFKAVCVEIRSGDSIYSFHCGFWKTISGRTSTFTKCAISPTFPFPPCLSLWQSEWEISPLCSRRHLNTWFSISGSVWGCLGGVASLKEPHWAKFWRVELFPAILVSLLCFMPAVKMWALSSCCLSCYLLPSLCSTVMVSYLPGTKSQYKYTLSFLSRHGHGMLSQQQRIGKHLYPGPYSLVLWLMGHFQTLEGLSWDQRLQWVNLESVESVSLCPLAFLICWSAAFV